MYLNGDDGNMVAYKRLHRCCCLHKSYMQHQLVDREECEQSPASRSREIKRSVRIFRKLGGCSFAVQMMDDDRKTFLPGLVEVECSSMDWGHLTAHSRFLQIRNLDALGCRPVKPGDMPVIGIDERVYVTLGPYDAERKKFVQCKLAVQVEHDASMDHLKKERFSISFVKENERDCNTCEQQQDDFPLTSVEGASLACACSSPSPATSCPGAGSAKQRRGEGRAQFFRWCIFT